MLVIPDKNQLTALDAHKQRQSVTQFNI